jgi:hypothetical protein
MNHAIPLSVQTEQTRRHTPDPGRMARMGQLIEEMMRAGTLIATEGCQPSAKGARVRLAEGSLPSLTPPPVVGCLRLPGTAGVPPAALARPGANSRRPQYIAMLRLRCSRNSWKLHQLRARLSPKTSPEDRQTGEQGSITHSYLAITRSRWACSSPWFRYSPFANTVRSDVSAANGATSSD